MCDKGPVQPLPGGAGHGAGWGTLVGAGGLNNYSTGFPNKDACRNGFYNLDDIFRTLAKEMGEKGVADFC